MLPYRPTLHYSLSYLTLLFSILPWTTILPLLKLDRNDTGPKRHRAETTRVNRPNRNTIDKAETTRWKLLMDEDLLTFRHQVVWYLEMLAQTQGPRRFIIKTIQYQQPLNTPRRFGSKTSRYQDVSGPKTFRHQDISAPNYFDDGWWIE